MISSKLSLAIYRLLAVAGQTRMLKCRLADDVVRGMLNAWSLHFQRSGATNPIVVNGHRFYHTGHPCALNMASGLYEPKTVRLVHRLLRSGMTFVDVGAHLGWYTMLAARAVGRTGHVYAFEPEPSNFDLLRHNVAVNGYGGCVTLVRKAICETPRRVSIFTSKEDSAYSSMYATPGVGTESFEVEATSLDHFFSERAWPHVDLIKIDIEGAEGTALRGMVELSRRTPDLKLIIEYIPALLAAAGDTPRRLFAGLEELGFHRRSIISWRPIPIESPEDIVRRVPNMNWYGNLLCEK